MTQVFDAIVIGAGQSGPPLAERLGQAGMKTAVIERHLMGGTCVVRGIATPVGIEIDEADEQRDRLKAPDQRLPQRKLGLCSLKTRWS